MDINKETCMKVPKVKKSLEEDDKLSEIVNNKFKEYKRDEIKLEKLNNVFKSYLNMTVGSKEAIINKKYFMEKFENKKKEVFELFKNLEKFYNEKIFEITNKIANNKTIIDDKLSDIERKLKDGLYHENLREKDLLKEKERKEDILEKKHEEYQNMLYLIQNTDNKINSTVIKKRECQHEYNVKSCPPDYYSSYIFLLILNVITFIANIFI